jgi:dihydrofolate reductase
MIKAILACDDLGGVSKGGTIPWPKNSKDLKWFKKKTTGGVIVMGSTTWEDPMMPGPLPNRKNVLATTRKKDYPGAHDYIDGVLSEEVWRIANKNKEKTTWVIGGPNIINQLLGVIDKFYLSRIPGDYGCDTFLPIEKIEKMFKKDWSEKHDTVEFQIWKKDNQ